MNKICSINSCDRRHKAKGYCQQHYDTFRKYGNPKYPIRSSFVNGGTCNVDGCENKSESIGYCDKHYKRFKKYGDPNFVKCVHGEGRKKHYLYATYSLMKSRCLNKNDQAYHNYGGRGIKISDRWLKNEGFMNFVSDMGERPLNHTLDRINVNGDYEPSNCRWATKHHQHANRRDNNENVGVHYSKLRNKWIAKLTINSTVYTAAFKTKEDAILHRKELELKYL